MPLSQRQHEYLKLMGIPVWNERGNEPGNVPHVDEVNAIEAGRIEEARVKEKRVEENVTVSKGAAISDSIDVQSSSYAQSSSVPKQVKAKTNEVFIPPQDVLKRDDLPEDWSKLIDAVAECKRCELHQTRTQTVFGVGDTEADWMIIGEAPGADEDKQGEPFVGRAGQLLTTILESIGLGREKVYIANTLKCHPPNNRDPKPVEAAQCRAYLEQQIALVSPKIILCVGRIATQNLLGTKDPLSRLRGKVHEMIHPSKPEKNIPIIATYHPAYLLRSPSQKRKVWDDLKMAYDLINRV